MDINITHKNPAERGISNDPAAWVRHGLNHRDTFTAAADWEVGCILMKEFWLTLTSKSHVNIRKAANTSLLDEPK